MSQKRKRSRSSVSSQRGVKRFRAARDDSYHGTGRSHRYIPYGKRDHRNSRYNNKNNYRHCRSSRERRRYDSGVEKNNRIYNENRRKSNRRNYERKYNQRHWSKRRYSTRSRSSRSSCHSSSRSSSSSSGSRSRSSSSSSTATEVQRSSSVPNDKDGHLICKPGDKIMNRYVVSGVLGEGTFGKVIECVDLCKDGERVAMKVVRNVRRYREAAKLEVNVLNTLNKNDPFSKSHCIHMLDSFQFHGHLCITFAKFGDSVFEFLKKNDFQRFDVDQVCRISYQLCKSVLFMHKNDLTHTDLKPENILFRDSTADLFYTNKSNKAFMKLRCANIELIDFGSATFDHEHHSSVVSTRHYRAPEVVLELGWSQPCDVWSIGCIMFELYTGNTLFQTHDNLEHMAMMERILGPMPSHLINTTRRSKYFYKGKLDWDDESSSGKYVKQHCKNLNKYMKGDSEEEKMFFELLSRMLDYSEDHRITLSSAIKHPYFRKFSRNNTYYSQSMCRNNSYEKVDSNSSSSNQVITNKSNDFICIDKGKYDRDYRKRLNDNVCNGKEKRRRNRSESECRKSSRDDIYWHIHSSSYYADNADNKDYEDDKYKVKNGNKYSGNYSDEECYKGAYEYNNGANNCNANNYNTSSKLNKEENSSYHYQTQYNLYNSTWNNHNFNNHSDYYNDKCKGTNNHIDGTYNYKHYQKENTYYNSKR